MIYIQYFKCFIDKCSIAVEWEENFVKLFSLNLFACNYLDFSGYFFTDFLIFEWIQSHSLRKTFEIFVVQTEPIVTPDDKALIAGRLISLWR